MEAIWNSKVYTRESVSSHLPGLYYLVCEKDSLNEENTWEPALAVQHLKKLTSLFYKDYFENLIVTSLAIDFASLMAKLIVKPMVT